MKNFKIGQKVKNQYGEILTIIDVLETTVRVREDYNNHYHISKIYAI